ncbi:MAG TPA: hypothetical protein VFM83_02385 [Gaiellaceae bacterium]|nr:hypothetical protein [Gaiellaceae bacterium]
MKLRLLVLVVAAGTLASAASAAPPARLADLPGAEALQPVPPLAPPQPPATEVPRIRGTVTSHERVVVGITADGTATSVSVVQRLLVRSLGDYTFYIPAPAVSVVAAPGSESQPGFRPNQIVWQGFSPRRRTLAARAELRPDDSVPALPLLVRVTGAPVGAGPFELALTMENTTRSRAFGFAGDAVAADIVQALDALHAAAGIDRPIEGRVVRVRGETTRVALQVSAPLALQGSVRFPAGTVSALTPSSFTRRLDRGTLRVTVRGVAQRAAVPRVRIVARPLVAAALPPRSARTLRATVLGYLRYARARQYETYLANPDPQGPSRATYVYDTAAATRTAAPLEPEHSDDSALPAAILVGGLTVLGLGLVVLWAHL